MAGKGAIDSFLDGDQPFSTYAPAAKPAGKVDLGGFLDGDQPLSTYRAEGLARAQDDQDSEFWKGFSGYMLKQGPEAVASTVEAGGILLGSDWLENQLAPRIRDLADQDEARYTPRVGALENIRWDQAATNPGAVIDDVADFAMYTLGNGLASTLPSIVGGLAGGAAGGGAGSMIAGPPGAVIGGTGGAILGATSTSYVQNTGPLFDELVAEGLAPEEAAVWAAGGGVVLAGLDAFYPAKVALQLGKGAQQEVRRKLVERILKEAGKGALQEGVTESAQEAVQTGIVTAATGKDVDWREASLRMANAFVGGALPGGLIGGGTGIRPDRVPDPTPKPAPGAPAAPAGGPSPAGPTPAAPGADPAAPGGPGAAVEPDLDVMPETGEDLAAEAEETAAVTEAALAAGAVGPGRRVRLRDREDDEEIATGTVQGYVGDPAEPTVRVVSDSGQAIELPLSAVIVEDIEAAPAAPEPVSRETPAAPAEEPVTVRPAAPAPGATIPAARAESAATSIQAPPEVPVVPVAGPAEQIEAARAEVNTVSLPEFAPFNNEELVQSLQTMVGDRFTVAKSPLADVAVLQNKDGAPLGQSINLGQLVEADESGAPVWKADAATTIADRIAQAESERATPPRPLAETDAAREYEARKAAGTAAAPVTVAAPEDIRTAEAQVDTEPTDGQKEAGNYRHAHIKFQGIDIAVENPKGSTRRGKAADGTEWEVEMPATYGYAKRSEGADGDQVDVYIGDDMASDNVFVVYQKDLNTGAFDEHKAMLGFPNVTSARRTYAAGFSDGRGKDRVQRIERMTLAQFKEKLAEGVFRKGPSNEGAKIKRRPKPQGGYRGRESLLVFLARRGGVKDQGGELASRDAQAWRKPFLKRLIQADGLDPDHAREIAAEAGYIPEDATLADFYKAVDRELRGQEVFPPEVAETLAAEDQATQEREREKDALQEVQAYSEASDLALTKAEAEEAAILVRQGYETEDAVAEVVDQAALAYEAELADNAAQEDLGDEWETPFEEVPATGQASEAGRETDAEGRPPAESQPRAEDEGQQPRQTPEKPGQGERRQEVATQQETKPEGLFVQLGARRYEVDSYEGASRRFLEVIAAADTGGSQTPTPLVTDADGEVIGHIAYNGRVFEGRPEDWKPGTRILYESRAKGGTLDQTAAAREKVATEQTDQGEQSVVPGAERISDKELAERRMEGRKRSTKPQKPADEGLFDVAGRSQEELFGDDDDVRYAAAWHGTPHDFDQFTLDHIGSGEGAQAYGWGLYFASRRGVAEYYRETLAGSERVVLEVQGGLFKRGERIDTATMSLASRQILQEHDYDIDATIQAMGLYSSLPDVTADRATLQRIRKRGGKSVTIKPGRLFKVELAPAEDEYLLWDKPLSEQSEKVKAALERVWPDNIDRDPRANYAGSDFYEGLAAAMMPALPADPPGTPRGWGFVQRGDEGQKTASLALRDAGIPGIKYLDGQSRNRPLKDIKREFLAELPEDAEIDEVADLIGTGHFSPQYDAVLKALQADDWLGFDYPSQAISAAYGNNLSNWDPSPALVKAVSDSREEGTFNYVIFDAGAVEILDRYAMSTLRRQGIPKEADPPVSSFDSDQGIKSHADYRAAKAGDQQAAERLVADVVKAETVEEARERFGSDVVYVPVIAEEATGDNAIPWTLAAYYAEATGADVAGDIQQVSMAYHTGAKPLERILARPLFDGAVEAGRRYVLVDDVTVMGGTLAELANHIRERGGEVAGIVTLVNANRNRIFSPRPNHIRLLEARFGDQLRNFGIEPRALTGPEASYLAGFKDADQLRTAVSNSQSDRRNRLRAKGLLPPEAEGDDQLALGAATTADDLGGLLAPEAFGPVVQAITEELRHIVPAARTALVPRLFATSASAAEASGGRQGQAVAGAYGHGLIALAYETIGPAPRAGRSYARHEAIHALRDLGFFTDREWRLLEAEARKGWIKEHGLPNRPEDSRVIEEAIAYRFQAWKPGERTLPGPVARIFNKLRRFFERMVNALKGRGFATVDDIFERVASGEVGRRQRVAKIVGSEDMVDDALEAAGRDRDETRGAMGEPRYAIADLRARAAGMADSLRGNLPVAPNVGVEAPEIEQDLNPLKRPFFVPKSLFKEWPALGAAVDRWSRRQAALQSSLTRVQREWDQATAKLSADEMETLSAILFRGDALGETYSAEDLANLVDENGEAIDVSGPVVAAYEDSRQLLDKLGNLVDQHERAMRNFLRRNIKPTLIQRIARGSPLSAEEANTLLTKRYALRSRLHSGNGDARTLAQRITDIENRLGYERGADDPVSRSIEDLDVVDRTLNRTSIKRRDADGNVIEGYVPHKFFGSWAVYRAVEEETEGGPQMRHELVADYAQHGFHASRADAIRAANRCAGANPDEQIVVRPVAMRFAGSTAATLPGPQFRALIGKVSEALEVTQDELKETLQDTIRPRSKRKWAGFKQQRLGIEGYSRDLDRVMRTHIGEAMRYVYLDKIKYEALSLEERMRLHEGTKRRRQLGEAFRNYTRDLLGGRQPLEDVLDPVMEQVDPLPMGLVGGAGTALAAGALSGNPLVGLLLGSYFGYRFYQTRKASGEMGGLHLRGATGEVLSTTAHLKLGMFLNVFSPVVNLTQLILNTASVLPYRYTAYGIGEAMKTVSGASKKWVRLLDRHNIDPLIKHSEISPHVYDKPSKLARYSMLLFDSVEKVNRSATFLGAYKQALDGNAPQKGRYWESLSQAERGRLAAGNSGAAQRYAMSVVTRTQFDYSAAMKPEVLRHVLARVPLQFKNFVAQQIAFVAGLKTPTGKAYTGWANAEVGRFLAHMFLVAGALGLPGWQLLDWLVEWLTGESPSVEVKKLALEMQARGELEGTIASVLARGLPSLMGVDISTRAGMGEKFLPQLEVGDLIGPLPSTVLRARQLAENEAGIVEQLRNLSTGLGAPLRALQAAANGMPLSTALTDPAAFVAALSDRKSLIANPWKKLRPDTADDTLSNADLFMIGVGGTPIEMSRIYDFGEIARLQDEKLDRLSNKYMNRVATAFREHMPHNPDRFRQEIITLRVDAREEGLLIGSQAIRRLLREMQMDRTMRTIRQARRQERPELARLAEGVR